MEIEKGEEKHWGVKEENRNGGRLFLLILAVRENKRYGLSKNRGEGKHLDVWLSRVPRREVRGVISFSVYV